ncbi:TonB-dependent receptor [Parahaliea maris]|uniref:TonB-dependent receptor n=1 Tax=Parahaliea maris TaxID=2716870 RepID=A0A5C9A9B7_9GAMM|nr:TonB-dependent receptor [Parahaliea maris]TXS95841.1 TonB-dependent receptor [Parahaliea maris]
MKKIYIITAAAVACQPSSVLFAQESNFALEEVIVTAQKREQTLRDVPSSVSAISKNYLQDSVSKSFNDLGNLVSGIEISGASDGFTPAIRIRGIGTNANSGVPPSVGIFLDEIPLADIGIAFTNINEVERVEVLKGPQSTLFGRSVSSGAIVINTVKPEHGANDGYIETNVGNNGLMQFYAGGNLSLGDAVAIRGSGYSTEGDGQVYNVMSGDTGEQTDNHGGRIQVSINLTDNFNANLSYEKHKLFAQGTAATVTEYGDGSEILALSTGAELRPFDKFSRKKQDYLENHRDSDTEIASARLEWVLDDTWSLTSLTAYQDWARVVDSSESEPNIAFDSILGPQPYQFGVTTLAAESLSEEFRVLYDGDWLTSVNGIFYSDSRNVNMAQLARPITVAVPSLGYIALVSGPDIDTQEFGIFSHNTISLSDRTQLTVGLRYSDIEREGAASTTIGGGQFLPLQNPAIVPVATAKPVEQTASWDALSGGLSLSYDLTEAFTIYGNYGRGFKAGNFSNQQVIGSTANPVDPFDEEFADSLEIGFKSVLLNNSLSWNGAVFVQEYTDYQVGIVDPITAISVVSNAGEVRVEGVETDFRWRVLEQFVVDGSVSYIDSRFESYENAPCTRPQYAAIACTGPSGTQDLSGTRVNNTSPWTANLNMTWQDSFANGMGWHLRGEAIFRDDRIYASDLDPDTKAPSYYAFNASFGLTSPSQAVEGILWVKNLTDEDYLVDIRSNSDGITRAGLRVSPGLERTYGIDLRYNF